MSRDEKRWLIQVSGICAAAVFVTALAAWVIPYLVYDLLLAVWHSYQGYSHSVDVQLQQLSQCSAAECLNG